MASSRSRSRQNRGGSSIRISDDEIMDLVSNLQQLLPQIHNIHSDRKKVSSGRVLQETCNYIRSLQKQVDDLSERLSQILEDTDTAHSAIIRSILMH